MQTCGKHWTLAVLHYSPLALRDKGILESEQRGGGEGPWREGGLPVSPNRVPAVSAVSPTIPILVRAIEFSIDDCLDSAKIAPLSQNLFRNKVANKATSI
jgi:hypothetical protein